MGQGDDEILYSHLSMVNPAELRELIASRAEWLLVSASGRSFALERHEIEIGGDEQRVNFGFLDDTGFHTWRLNSFDHKGGEITLDVAGAFAQKRQTMRLVARTPASVFTAEIELARLERANEIARLIMNGAAGAKLGRVALNVETGRLAQINYDTVDRVPMAAIGDVTGALSIEAVFTAAMTWLEKLGRRKKRPVRTVRIICETPQAKNAQKLHALLTDRWRSRIVIGEVVRRHEPPVIADLPRRRISDLWREKPKKIVLPGDARPGRTAQTIIALAPESIDVIFSKHGESLRFLGLPFARVRRMADQEKAWYGIGREKRILNDASWKGLVELVKELTVHRRPGANKRHDLYKMASEAWLESILRRNIRLLDANLILSPLYNQFRSSSDKIDMLALRRDGRLVIIELKTQPDREMVFQAADYWRKIELQRRRGVLAAADLFDGREILDRPALLYLAAPAWSFHRDFEFFAASVAPEIELWRFELHENWRQTPKVLQRRSVNEDVRL